MEVETLSDRDSIPVDNNKGLDYDGLSSGQRRLGMLVKVLEEDRLYELFIEYSTWSDLTEQEKIDELNNNSNWKEFKTSPINSEILIVTGSTVTLDEDFNYIGVSGSTSTVNLPSSPEEYLEYIITDLRGDAETNSITISGNGNLINGESEIIINTNYGSFRLKYTGTFWYITSMYF
ncbi:MAG: hypothetical protein ACOC1X_04080 [Promethearchaeota archaeon]